MQLNDAVNWLVRGLLIIGLVCMAIAHLKMWGWLPTRGGFLRAGAIWEWCALSATAFVGAWACRTFK